MSQRISVSVRVRPLRSPDGASAVAPTSGGGITAKGKRYACRLPTASTLI